MPPGSAGPALTLDEALRPLPYHRDTVAYLKEREADLWSWFSSTGFLDEHAKSVRLELLKNAYRFDRAEHGDLYAAVDEVTGRLGLAAPVIVYQAQNAPAMNAYLAYIPGEAHVVFEGPVRDTLNDDELRATLAHELTHYLLWEKDGRELLIADQALAAMANHPRAEPSHIESARLFRLYLEVHADRGALAVLRDPLAAVASLVKVQTGLADVSAESYLRQAEEIFSQTEVKTEELTHPESYIRARALQLWAGQGEAADAEVARMIEGPLDLGRLTLLGQVRLTALTRRVLARFLKPAWLRTTARLAHARLFFPDLDPDADAGELEMPEPAAPSIADYLGYLLLDMASADHADDEAVLAAALQAAEELGATAPFLKGAADDLGVSKRAIARLKKNAADIVAGAANAAPPET